MDEIYTRGRNKGAQRAYRGISLFKMLLIEDKGIMIHSGKARVDASITESPRSPKGRKTYQVAEDRFEQYRS